MNSCAVLAGKSGRTSSTLATVVMIATGSNWVGSKAIVLVEQRIDRERRRLRGEQRVAVRIGGEHRFRADIAGGAGAVFHHHRLAEPLLQAVGDDARDGIDAAAGRNADDDPDRPVGIVGRGVLRPMRADA